MPERFKVLVIGGGPAGIAAAVRSAESGAGVGIVDDNLSLGGQIWRNEFEEKPSNHVAEWRERLRKSDVSVLGGTRVFQHAEPGVVLAEREGNLLELRYEKLVLATGARERFLPFPGWTLPNVMGAGGLQALAKSGLPLQGNRVVVAGTGPLLLAVASYLRRHGAEIPLICEQTPWSKLAIFGTTMLANKQKITQALELKRALADVPFSTSTWPVAAHGHNFLEHVTISRRGKLEEIPCDYLACGFHLVPNTEIAAQMGCRLCAGFVQVDDFQRTTVANVFCAGEPTGIGGLELSLVEGEIAGLAATGNEREAQRLFSQRRTWQRFRRRLDRAFALRTELKSMASPDTIVCRCEDVPYSRLNGHSSWRAAKLHTRCGMGPCQGRVCGPACEYLFGWNSDSVRPPIFPVRVSSLSGTAMSSMRNQTEVRGDRP